MINAYALYNDNAHIMLFSYFTTLIEVLEQSCFINFSFNNFKYCELKFVVVMFLNHFVSINFELKYYITDYFRPCIYVFPMHNYFSVNTNN